jgi:hypothetical protein
MNMLSTGQKIVLTVTVIPVIGVGIAGALGTYANMQSVMHRSSTALGLVAAGEGATMVLSLIALSLTLLGQHTPLPVRAGLWLLPALGSATGVAVAPGGPYALVYAVTPMAMTVSAEGLSLVARRIVSYHDGVDGNAKLRGELMWHANRAVNGGALGRRISRAAVWRLSRQAASTDVALSAILADSQRDRIADGADANLAAVLGGVAKPVAAVAAPATMPELTVAETVAAVAAPATMPELTVAETVAAVAAPATMPELPVAETVAAVAAPATMPELPVAETVAPQVSSVAETVAEQSTSPDDVAKYLTGPELADLRGVAPATVRSWVKRGKLTPAAYDAVGRPLFLP